MRSDYDIVTFDCYGTLVDWEEGITRAFRDAPGRSFPSIDRNELLSLHAEIEPRVQSERYRSYRDVLRETAFRIGERLGGKLSREDASFLPTSLGRWPLFQDTAPALRRLADAGYGMGILSNVDEDLLATTLSGLDVDFEIVVTAEQVRSYKPAEGHFLEARRRIGARRWLHAAQSWFHDVEPARRLAIPVAWINRKSERAPDVDRPVRELRDLHDLADWLVPPN